MALLIPVETAYNVEALTGSNSTRTNCSFMSRCVRIQVSRSLRTSFNVLNQSLR